MAWDLRWRDKERIKRKWAEWQFPLGFLTVDIMWPANQPAPATDRLLNCKCFLVRHSVTAMTEITNTVPISKKGFNNNYDTLEINENKQRTKQSQQRNRIPRQKPRHIEPVEDLRTGGNKESWKRKRNETWNDCYDAFSSRVGRQKNQFTAHETGELT